MMRIYNTLTKKKDSLEIGDDRKINFFVCGPTVYDFSHIGHARTYVLFDAFVKYLRIQGFDVFYLQNITDIDDKIIKRSLETEEDFSELTKRFEEEYYKDMNLLKVDSVSEYARATDYIKEIISQVERLLENGFAYTIEDGIYYDISKFDNYGKLSGRTTEQAEDGTSRIDESIKKKNKGDFCLWKFSKENEPKWKSPWGDGRPGWHIEDTAIAESFFGTQYNIHGGARDLIFPHHEAEIAQMEAISGKSPFVKYWMHTGFLTVEREKMSKSLNNFITIRDFVEKHSPRVLRFLALKSHYRSPIDYNEKNIDQIYQELRRIDRFIGSLENQEAEDSHSKKRETEETVAKYKKEINEALQDDFNTPIAIASLFSFISEMNPKLNNADKETINEFLEDIDKIFGFLITSPKERLVEYLTTSERSIELEGKDDTEDHIRELANEREIARNSGNFKEADNIRKKIEEKGYLIEDTKEGFKIKKL